MIDGTERRVTVDAQRQDRVFEVADDFAWFEELTITGGETPACGGGIYGSFGDFSVERTTITGNRAAQGGGLCGCFTVTRSTISNNRSAGDGGGGIDFCGTQVRYSTISGNRAGGQGGGLVLAGADASFVSNTTVTQNRSAGPGGGLVIDVLTDYGVSASVIAGNRAEGDITSSMADCEVVSGFGDVRGSVTGLGTGCPIVSGSTSVSPDQVFDRVLDAALADNGGPTLTHALLAPGGEPSDNPAIDLTNSCGSAPAADQRGFAVPIDGDEDGDARCDAGSVEFGASEPPPPGGVTISIGVSSPIEIPAEGGSFRFSYALANTTGEPQTVEMWTEATLPDGSIRGPLYGPETIRIFGGLSGCCITQNVPAGAPAGDYTYTAYVGRFPDAPLDSDSLPGVKLAVQWGRPTVSTWDALYTARETSVTTTDLDDIDAHAASTEPETFSMSAAYPNPSRGVATLTFATPETTDVRLVVYDALGREVAVLLDDTVEAGQHTVAFDGSGLPSGTYVVRATAGASVQTTHVTVLH